MSEYEGEDGADYESHEHTADTDTDLYAIFEMKLFLAREQTLGELAAFYLMFEGEQPTDNIDLCYWFFDNFEPGTTGWKKKFRYYH